MEKKPDFKELAKGLDDLKDLRNHFTLGNDEPFTGTENDLKKLFAKHSAEYKTEFKGNISAFIKYEINKTNRVIKRAENVTKINENSYQKHYSYLDYLEKRSQQRNPENDSNEGIKKPYKSLTRARAFFIGLLQESKKVNFLNGRELKKSEIIKFVEETWEGQSGKTVYEEVLLIISETNPINSHYKELHLKDFEYGLKLYNELI